jgi:RNA-directed DNA polymerase
MTASLVDEWKAIDWKSVEVSVFKLQKRIYRASKEGNVKLCHKLQRLLRKSRSAKLLATRRVTQDNQGRKTPGIDGKTALTQRERLEIANGLSLEGKATPVRRIYIPKASGEPRPLGIPTIRERAKQALVKLCLEPEWEAKFEPNSFGFRPGRCVHDAISQIFNNIKYRKMFVLDADIAGCFDNINHDYMLKKLNTSSEIRRVIRGWLKAGYVEGHELFPSDAGTPQGGVISPLLANIALHGLEEYITSQYPERPRSQGRQYWKPKIVRYADDFVVFHPCQEVILEVRDKISEWLKPVGLELKESKTRICNTNEGFDFLGFTIKHQKPGVNKRGFLVNVQSGYKTRLEHVTHITPSKKSFEVYKRKLKEIISSHKSGKQDVLIARLNAVIRGWGNYFRYYQCWKTFGKVDRYLWLVLRRWGLRRSGKGSKYTKRKYWKENIFSAKGRDLIRHSSISKKIHVQIQRQRSPYDGDWKYWGNRLKFLPTIPKDVAFLLRKQKAKCTDCGLNFTPTDRMEIHHKDGNHSNNHHKNLELLHRHCHDRKHRLNQASIHDKD